MRPGRSDLTPALNRLKTAGRTALRGLLDLLCPPRCLLCGAFPDRDDGDPAFCPGCRAGMTPLPEAHCRYCGQPFTTTIPTHHTCALCLEKKPAFEKATAAGLYEGALRTAIHRLKYEGRTELARPLAAFMAENLAPPFHPPEADLVLPMPLHSRRLKKRGFNQALLLAQALYAPWPGIVRWDLLRRTRPTRPQVGLSEEQRKRNVRGAFVVEQPQLLEGRPVILVDDVYTSGATARECAKVLRQAGVDRVLVLTLARVA
ncbi:MAG: ComF family protein [Thermodesulfobacteriota bacterium]